MKIAVGQFAPTADTAENLGTMRRLTEQAAAGGAQLVVFPEEAMFSEQLLGEDFEELVLRGWSGFVQQLSFLAAQTGVAVIAGGYEGSADGRPYNTLVAVDAQGAILGTYRKLHLYDAFSHRESDRIRPGDKGVTVVRIGELAVGMITCYDLRFPEICRAVVDAGAELLTVPAAWFAGSTRWTTGRHCSRPARSRTPSGSRPRTPAPSTRWAAPRCSTRSAWWSPRRGRTKPC